MMVVVENHEGTPECSTACKMGWEWERQRGEVRESSRDEGRMGLPSVTLVSRSCLQQTGDGDIQRVLGVV